MAMCIDLVVRGDSESFISKPIRFPPAIVSKSSSAQDFDAFSRVEGMDEAPAPAADAERLEPLQGQRGAVGVGRVRLQ